MDVEYQFSDGLLEYCSTIVEMEKRVQDILSGEKPELLWFLEHQHVYTVGTDEKLILQSQVKGKIPFVSSGRGGKYTYHGPGQLIMYTILDLRKRNLCDVKKFIWSLEEVAIRTLGRFQITSNRKEEAPGAWVQVNNIEKKIAAMGIRIRKWITFHGIAINISTDLNNYSRISPCGFESNQVTSMLDLGVITDIPSVRKIIIEEFHNIFK